MGISPANKEMTNHLPLHSQSTHGVDDRSAFVRSEAPNEFPGLSVKYVRGADPVVKLLDGDGNTQEELSIQKWDTDTVIEFLREHME
ncbi:hypothetical protein AVEN_80659-1 [Araneus ventricosus]|uniref:Selenoprotein F n=1 Tax=Araneus ventricosus TaxID=182803 RepID=A0A4Y2GD80_ARAVE|nr:hypothetical protein AVEN_80659-1 [Araneus ventricosus]